MTGGRCETELPKRKSIRLPEHDYSSPGAYFVTICTKDREQLFWDMRKAPHDPVGAAISRPPNETPLPVPLTAEGELAGRAIRQMAEVYSGITVDRYVIMPNHVHMILRIDTDGDGRLIAAPTVGRAVGQMKRWVSVRAGRPLWQRSFHEHIIRNERDYREIWNYIDGNPARWTEDRYFTA
ncbi:MAG: transposase [Oscillospiraceae bacterium]|nr:transposase [Oscillospiraceae bacterium]